MIITNFETGEESAFLTWIEVYDLLAYEVLELKNVEDFKWKVQEVMFKNDLERDSLDGVRYVFATIGSEFLEISFKETDKVFNKLMEVVEHETGSKTIEDLDDCLSLKFLRLAVPWRIIDCKQISHSTTSLLS